MKNKFKVVLPIVLVSSAVFVLFQSQKSKPAVNTVSTDSSNQTNNVNTTDENIVQASFQSLTILGDRCRGCGRCVRIDPSHFEMNRGIVSVISSNNLNSSSLQLAINNCPTNAIVLE